MDFFPEDSNMIVTGTKYAQVRLFDIRSKQRRAICDVEVGENAVTAVKVSHDSR